MTKKKKTERAKAEKVVANGAEKKPREIDIHFRGHVYPGLARGDEFVGLLCRTPRGVGHFSWRAAIDKAMAACD